MSEGARAIGLQNLVGIEIDEAACATRAAAGHRTIRADVAAFDVSRLAGKVAALCGSPVCVQFSAAGNRAGVIVLHILADSIRDASAGRKTRARRRMEMVRALRQSPWLGDAPVKTMDASAWRRDSQATWKRKLLARKGSPARLRRDMASAPPGAHLTREQRSERIWAAVRSAALVLEPARYIEACAPEWVALEQVPAVLPLWQVYADELGKRGYSTWCGVLNAADYGVPQTRVRAILIASRTRQVYRPEPTHYDARKGDQLWGTPWVSMAEALGWGATSRPVPTVTAGGTGTGGAEPFGHRDRDALAAEQDAGRWALRMDTQSKATLPRSADEPAPTIQFAHRSNLAAWVLHTNRGQDEAGNRQTADPQSAPALTAKSGGQWVLRAGNQANAAERPAPAPAPTIAFGHAASGMTWKLRNNNNNNNACERSPDEPAGTLFFGGRSNWAGWVAERPATTVQGDPRVGRPGHKDRDKGEAQFAVDSVRITPEEAAALQSFPPGYPFQGTKTAIFTQIGNAVPPLLAEHFLAMAAGIARAEAAA
jgi:DNA (cytosine-5)-methyltransferase 1